jgi:hypothetical protein
MSAQGQLLGQILPMLDEVEIPHMVVGSLASSFHGEPRQTRDIDIVIDPEPDALRRLVDMLPTEQLYADAGAAKAYLNRWLRALDLDDAWERAQQLTGPP